MSTIPVYSSRQTLTANEQLQNIRQKLEWIEKLVGNKKIDDGHNKNESKYGTQKQTKQRYFASSNFMLLKNSENELSEKQDRKRYFDQHELEQQSEQLALISQLNVIQQKLFCYVEKLLESDRQLQAVLAGNRRMRYNQLVLDSLRQDVQQQKLLNLNLQKLTKK